MIGDDHPLVSRLRLQNRVGKRQPRLTDSLWQTRWTVSTWRDYLAASEAELDLAAICRCTHTGRPLGDAVFVSELKKTTERHLKPQRKGKRKGDVLDARPTNLPLNAQQGTG